MKIVLKSIFLIGYGFLFVLGQIFSFSTIRPWHKQIRGQIEVYILFVISIIGCVAIVYRYSVIEKKLFKNIFRI